MLWSFICAFEVAYYHFPTRPERRDLGSCRCRRPWKALVLFSVALDVDLCIQYGRALCDLAYPSLKNEKKVFEAIKVCNSLPCGLQKSRDLLKHRLKSETTLHLL